MHVAIENGKEYVRLFSHYGRTDDLDSNPQAGRKECRYCSTEDHAKGNWAVLMKDKQGDKKGYKPVALFASNIGSEKARGSATHSEQQIVKEVSEVSQLPNEIQDLIRFKDLLIMYPSNL